VLWLWLGCAHNLESRFPWKLEPEPTEGHIVVMPFVGAYDAPELRLDAGFADRLVNSADRENKRRERTREVRKVPSQVGVALPGQVAAVLGDAWHASFTVGRLPSRTRERLTQAIRGKADLDQILGEIGRTTPSDGVWVTWVNALESAPMTSEADAGDVLVTGGGPVVVDFDDEPYRVQARLGMALVAADGEVVVRYEDDFETVLSGNRGAPRVGRDLAAQLARDVAQFWPTDPRLIDPNVAEPEVGGADPADPPPRRAEVLFRGRPI
jgi:hypothetical protein